MTENVHVVVRVRPYLPGEAATRACLHVTPQLQQICVGKQRCFAFDAVLDMHCSDDEVYAAVGRTPTTAFLDGVNACAMAYGQTGAGKTYTMQHMGVMVVQDVFAALERDAQLLPLQQQQQQQSQSPLQQSAGNKHSSSSLSRGCTPRAVAGPTAGEEVCRTARSCSRAESVACRGVGVDVTTAAAAVADMTPTLTFSALEVYKDEVKDLLYHAAASSSSAAAAAADTSPENSSVCATTAAAAAASSSSSSSLKLREDPKLGVCVVGLSEVAVHNAAELHALLERAMAKRTTAATLMNTTSSRSHCVLTLTLTRRGTTSRLCLVDLAGSERFKRSLGLGTRAGSMSSNSNNNNNNSNSNNSNNNNSRHDSPMSSAWLSVDGEQQQQAALLDRMREGICVNTGLLALGNVIVALCERKPHVPFRASKLTRLLQPMLSGNSRTTMVACVSPHSASLDETLNTLKYAYRAKAIRTTPQLAVTRFASYAEAERTIAALRLELNELQQQLTATMTDTTTTTTTTTTTAATTMTTPRQPPAAQATATAAPLPPPSAMTLGIPPLAAATTTTLTTTMTTPRRQQLQQPLSYTANDRNNSSSSSVLTTTTTNAAAATAAAAPSALVAEHATADVARVVAALQQQVSQLDVLLTHERQTSKRLEDELFCAEYTTMVEVEKRKALEQQVALLERCLAHTRGTTATTTTRTTSKAAGVRSGSSSGGNSKKATSTSATHKRRRAAHSAAAMTTVAAAAAATPAAVTPTATERVVLVSDGGDVQSPRPATTTSSAAATTAPHEQQQPRSRQRRGSSATPRAQHSHSGHSISNSSYTSATEGNTHTLVASPCPLAPTPTTTPTAASAAAAASATAAAAATVPVLSLSVSPSPRAASAASPRSTSRVVVYDDDVDNNNNNNNNNNNSRSGHNNNNNSQDALLHELERAMAEAHDVQQQHECQRRQLDEAVASLASAQHARTQLEQERTRSLATLEAAPRVSKAEKQLHRHKLQRHYRDALRRADEVVQQARQRVGELEATVRGLQQRVAAAQATQHALQQRHAEAQERQRRHAEATARQTREARREVNDAWQQWMTQLSQLRRRCVTTRATTATTANRGAADATSTSATRTAAVDTSTAPTLSHNADGQDTTTATTAAANVSVSSRRRGKVVRTMRDVQAEIDAEVRCLVDVEKELDELQSYRVLLCRVCDEDVQLWRRTRETLTRRARHIDADLADAEMALSTPSQRAALTRERDEVHAKLQQLRRFDDVFTTGTQQLQELDTRIDSLCDVRRYRMQRVRRLQNMAADTNSDNNNNSCNCDSATDDDGSNSSSGGVVSVATNATAAASAAAMDAGAAVTATSAAAAAVADVRKTDGNSSSNNKQRHHVHFVDDDDDDDDDDDNNSATANDERARVLLRKLPSVRELVASRAPHATTANDSSSSNVIVCSIHKRTAAPGSSGNSVTASAVTATSSARKDATNICNDSSGGDADNDDKDVVTRNVPPPQQQQQQQQHTRERELEATVDALAKALHRAEHEVTVLRAATAREHSSSSSNKDNNNEESNSSNVFVRTPRVTHKAVPTQLRVMNESVPVDNNNNNSSSSRESASTLLA